MKKFLRRWLLALLLLGTSFLLPRISRAAGNDNPTGPTGEYNGSITTAGSYDPYTGNAKRFVEDLTVTGSLGAYPLKWTRILNTRQGSAAGFGDGGSWTHSYRWGLWVRPYQSHVSEEDPYEGPDGQVTYPDGRTMELEANPDGTYFQKHGIEPLGRIQNMPGGNYDLIMADGGRVKFEHPPGTSGGYSLVATRIVDPHGQTTTIARDSAGRLSRVTEPGGRYLQINYTTFSYPSPITPGVTVYYDVISSVQAFASAGNLTETVNYTYTYEIVDYGFRSYNLARVNYGDGTQATYTYFPNSGPNGIAGGRMETCRDVRYAGAMNNIKYEYAVWSTTHRVAVGQVKREKNLTTGQVVSEVTYPPTHPESNDPTRFVRTETRGDGATRSFQYSIAGGELESYTDFKNQRSYIGYALAPVGYNYLRIFTDARGNATSTEKERTAGAVMAVIHHDNTSIRYTYSDPTNPYWLATKTDENGKITRYTRNPGTNTIQRIEYPDTGDETFTYNARGQVLTHRLTSGGTETFEYDNGANNRGLKTRHWAPATPSDPAPAPTVYLYYTSGPHTDRLSSVTDPRGNTTSYQYNLRGQVTRVTHPDGFYTQSGYNADGTLAWTADEKHPGAATDVNQRTRHVYDEYKRVISVTNPLNQTTTTSYALDLAWANPLLHTTTSIKYVVSPMGKNTVFEYDANFRKINQVSALATTEEAWTLFEYDAVGNLTKTTDPKWNQTAFGYDNRNRQVTVTNALNRTTTTTYDGVGNKLQVRQPDGTTDSKTYDSMNRVLTETDDAMSRTTTFTYLPSGMLKTVTDAKNQTTTFEYDARNLKTKMTYHNGDYQTWTYDTNGNLIARRTAAAPTAQNVYQKFSYDERNRKEVMWWGTTADPANQTGIVWGTGIDRSTFTYEANGALATANNSFSNITRTYDAAGRLASDAQTVAGLALRTVQYTYDADGQTTRLYVANGNGYDHRYTYDAMGRLNKIRDSLNTDEFGYSYDAASNETQRLNYYNSVAQVYTRDVLNRMSRRDLKEGSAAPFSSEVYTFDVMNRVLAIDREDGKRDRFYYNFAGELTSAHYGWNSAGSTRSVSYVLDAVGNRTQVVDAGVSKTYVPDILNRYTSVGGVAITHGPAHQIGAYQANSYSYVGDRYLATMNGPATYTLGYDALGRCVRRRLQGEVTYYVYDGEKPILEYKANGTLAGSNVYGKGIDEILMRADYVVVPGGQGYFYQQNHLGSVTHLTGWAGEVIEKYSYDAYGAPTTTYTAGVFNNRFKFTGREYASSFGVYEYRNRAYHPGLGRFVSEDPIGLQMAGAKPTPDAAALFPPGQAPETYSSSEFNLYSYCHNDPVNKTDPLGLWSQWTNLMLWQGGGDGTVSEQFSRMQIQQQAMAAMDKWASWAKDKKKEVAGTVNSKGEATVGPERDRHPTRSNPGPITADTRAIWHLHLLLPKTAPYKFSSPNDTRSITRNPTLAHYVGVVNAAAGRFTIFAHTPEMPYMHFIRLGPQPFPQPPLD